MSPQTPLLTAAFVLIACQGFAAELPVPRARVIPLEVGTPTGDIESAGSLLAADVDDDGGMELLVTAPGYLGAYETDGPRLWSKRLDIRVGGQSESQGLPGHHGPGVAAGDLDGDGKTEVAFLTQDSVVHVLDGASGNEEWTAAPAVPEGAERWEQVMVASFRGQGDRDLLLQATNKDGYRTGCYLAAYAAEALRAGGAPLWRREDFMSCAHNGARLADLDGDGRDEVLGPTLLGPDGGLLSEIPLRGHVDSIFAGDVDPRRPGLEVVMLEEGGRDGNRVFLTSKDGLIWETHYAHQEPQNAALGRFDTSRPGLQVWCRSRNDEHQKPFVFDGHGELISDYEMDAVAPPGWTVAGVEVIWTIDWTGEQRQLAAAKERHTNGDVCLFDPISGEFKLRIPEAAARLYVADVTGDWREELVVWAGSQLHLYENPAPNPRPNHPRLWQDPAYRRAKSVWNYYSP